MNKQLQGLLSKEMERGDFLKYAGAILLTVSGISGILRAVLQHDGSSSQQSNRLARSHGYGTSSYGR